jgi:hypothetical protein
MLDVDRDQFGRKITCERPYTELHGGIVWSLRLLHSRWLGKQAGSFIVYRKMGSKLYIACMVAATILVPELQAETPRAPQAKIELPVDRAYEAWVNQGIASGRLTESCASYQDDRERYPSTIKDMGENLVYGDLNNDGVTDFIAHIGDTTCGGGNALWHGQFFVGVSRGASFSFGSSGDSIYSQYLGAIDDWDKGFIWEVNAIQRGIVSGVFLDNETQIKGRCEGYRGNSNVRRTFQFDAARNQIINLGSPVIDREWTDKWCSTR